MRTTRAYSSVGSPLPDRSLEPYYTDLRVLEILYAFSGDRRALVATDPGGYFRVFVEHWSVIRHEEETHGWSGWIGIWHLHHSSLTGQLSDAIRLAHSFIDAAG